MCNYSPVHLFTNDYFHANIAGLSCHNWQYRMKILIIYSTKILIYLQSDHIVEKVTKFLTI